jgi:broad specificity phosphatase PhoE
MPFDEACVVRNPSAENRFAGMTDVELSEESREQPRCLAERLSCQKITAVYAPPLGRTVEPADSCLSRAAEEERGKSSESRTQYLVLAF